MIARNEPTGRCGEAERDRCGVEVWQKRTYAKRISGKGVTVSRTLSECEVK